jgi:TatD DNase family protein
MAPLIDSHAHIYLPEFDVDRGALLDAAEGISHVLMPAIDMTTHGAMMKVQADYPHCLAMMGVHPCSVTGDPEEELQIAGELLAAHPFIAIGETGLDLYWDKSFLAQQYTAFHRQIEWALSRNLPIVIHSREATTECIEVVRQYPGLRGVFHCFSGTAAEAEQVIALGLYLGIGGVITFKNAGLDRVVAPIGLKHLLLETDAPYLAPVPYRGKRNQPAYLSLVANKLAEVKGLSVEEVAVATTANAINLFNLGDKP